MLYPGQQRFSQIFFKNKLPRGYFYAFRSDGKTRFSSPSVDNIIKEESPPPQSFCEENNHPNIPDEKNNNPDKLYTLNEARNLLKAQGFLLITQRAFDDIISEKYAKAYEKARQESEQKTLSGASQGQESKIIASENEQDLQENPSQEPFSGIDVLQQEAELAQLNQELQELQSSLASSILLTEHEQSLALERHKTAQALQQVEVLKELQKEAVLMQAISPWAVDPDVVLLMTRNHFSVNENGAVVPVSPDGGVTPYDANLMSLEAYYENFRKNKPYLVKASSSQGAGSNSQGKGSLDSSATFEQLADMPIEQFIKRGGLSGKTR